MLAYRYQQVLALPCFAEQDGTYRNYAGVERQLQAATTPISAEIMSITAWAEKLAACYTTAREENMLGVAPPNPREGEG